MGASASIVVAVWGNAYAAYINRWWESVKNLETKPDEIVLVSDQADSSGLFESVPEWVSCTVLKVIGNCQHYQEWWSLAVHSATSDWIVQMPIDDQFAPTALNELSEIESDLVVDRTQFLQGGGWPSSWNPQNTQDRHFAPAGVAPFRRSLLHIWEQIPNDCHWNDYVFYLLLAKNDVKVHHTNNLRMIHDLGYDHETMSGVMLDGGKRQKADRQLKEIRERLEI